MKLWDLATDEWNYINKGYQLIRFPISVIQFVSIFLVAWFPEIDRTTSFFIMAGMGLVLMVVCSGVGHVDYGKRGTFEKQATIARKSSPYDRDTAKALLYLLEDRAQTHESKEIQKDLEYWTTPLNEEN